MSERNAGPQKPTDTRASVAQALLPARSETEGPAHIKIAPPFDIGRYTCAAVPGTLIASVAGASGNTIHKTM